MQLKIKDGKIHRRGKLNKILSDTKNTDTNRCAVKVYRRLIQDSGLRVISSSPSATEDSQCRGADARFSAKALSPPVDVVW
ncbi:hypothetical protein TNCV_1847211 [Trichonephila clavipes]|nr:hypothetical protein TNCV_1847211 [Trichonephila clavipes]